MTLKCASFFAGVGGIDLGFEQTGDFEVVYANEFDPYPVKTYELNSALKVSLNLENAEPQIYFKVEKLAKIQPSISL